MPNAQKNSVRRCGVGFTESSIQHVGTNLWVTKGESDFTKKRRKVDKAQFKQSTTTIIS